MSHIYLDHNATTPMNPLVLEAMLPVYREAYGNPSSIHALGRVSRVKLDEAREKVAGLIGAKPREIVFTSGGTESNNFALFGVAFGSKEKGRHLITSQIEHASVSNACKQLETLGFEIDYMPVNSQGKIDLNQLQESIRSDTLLVSIQLANNEVGTIQNIESIGNLLQERGVLFHTDAVQAVGKIPINVSSLRVDFLSLSAHKLYGPKGVGAFYIRRGSRALLPLINGGNQEFKRRGGTENISGIVGLGVACQIAQENMDANQRHLLHLRNNLENFLKDHIPGITVFASESERLPNTLGFAVDSVQGEELLIALDMEGIAVSTGSACSSGSLLPSPVLSAMGISTEKINSSLRVSLGVGNTEVEMDRFAGILKQIVKRLRRSSILINER